MFYANCGTYECGVKAETVLVSTQLLPVLVLAALVVWDESKTVVALGLTIDDYDFRWTYERKATMKY